MAQLGYLSIAAFALILAISTQHAVALNCWYCISHTNAGCSDPFNSSKLHKLDYHECSGLCVKLVYNNSDDVKITYRFCAKDQEDVKKQCNQTGKISCESCSKDGCNTAIKYGPIALFVVIPMAIAKIFLE